MGKADSNRDKIGYSAEEFLEFYKNALEDYIIKKIMSSLKTYQIDRKKIKSGIHKENIAILFLSYIFNRQSSKDILNEWKIAQVV